MEYPALKEKNAYRSGLQGIPFPDFIIHIVTSNHLQIFLPLYGLLWISVYTTSPISRRNGCVWKAACGHKESDVAEFQEC